MMVSAAVKDPKDDQITNKDSSVTNKDGNNILEKGASDDSRKENKDELRTLIASNDNEELGESASESSNNEQAPAGENL
jgi:hypothetical protein